MINNNQNIEELVKRIKESQSSEEINNILEATKELQEFKNSTTIQTQILRLIAINRYTSLNTLKKVFNISKQLDNNYLLCNLINNDKFPEDNKKNALQEIIFSCYNKEPCNKALFVGLLNQTISCLTSSNITNEQDVENLYNAMAHVSRGKKLTDENKETLKGSSIWERLIDAIVHYISKVCGLFTTQNDIRRAVLDNFDIGSNPLGINNKNIKAALGLTFTQKEARDNFNSVTDTFAAKISAERNKGDRPINILAELIM